VRNLPKSWEKSFAISKRSVHSRRAKIVQNSIFGRFRILFFRKSVNVVTRTSVTEFWVCMGLTVYNSSKSEGGSYIFSVHFSAFFSQYYAHDDAAASLGHFPKVDTPSQNLEASPLAKKLCRVHLGETPI
jgi:hypothetical protein